MKKICVVTADRAEYGLLTPLIRRINEDDELELELVVTGTHLSSEKGMTIKQIEEDGFPIKTSIPIIENGDTAYDISLTVANAVKGFADYFRVNRPDMLVILGDRTELLGVAIAAMNENIIIAHINGGEVTVGAVDDCVRHALTKMSYIHFTGTEIYRRRVIQLGENPDRVFNVGALSAENILTVPLMNSDEIRKEIGIESDIKYAMVTLHPETVVDYSPEFMANILCKSMKKNKDLFFVITASNSDVGGNEINKIFHRFALESDNASYIISLGMKRYLSALKYAEFVLGNSSSGIVEAPILGTPTVNVGNRQSGRVMVETIINVPFEIDKLLKAIEIARQRKHTPSNIYGDGKVSEKIVSIIKHVLKHQKIDLKKGFYDFPV